MLWCLMGHQSAQTKVPVVGNLVLVDDPMGTLLDWGLVLLVLQEPRETESLE